MEGALARPIFDRLGAKKGYVIRDQHSGRHNNYMTECDCEKVGAYLWSLKAIGLWPLLSVNQQKTLGTVLKNAAQFDMVRGSNMKADVSCAMCKIDFNTKILGCVEKTLSSFDGLCLDCVKHRKRNGENTSVCRMPHEGFKGVAKASDEQY